MDTQYQEALDYWLGQARQHWLSLRRQSQAHVAIALKRFGDRQVPDGIMQSIREHSLTDEELGMYWRDLERSWWWYRAPIETQAMMIEAFDEVSADAQAVEDCRKAVKLDPTDATAHYNLACAFALLKRVRESVQSLERAVALEPGFRDEARSDADFDNVRDDERFARLVMGL